MLGFLEKSRVKHIFGGIVYRLLRLGVLSEYEAHSLYEAKPKSKQLYGVAGRALFGRRFALSALGSWRHCACHRNITVRLQGAKISRFKITFLVNALLLLTWLWLILFRSYRVFDDFRMVLVRIRNVDIEFPFTPYDCQMKYMEKVVEALQLVSLTTDLLKTSVHMMYWG